MGLRDSLGTTQALPLQQETQGPARFESFTSNAGSSKVFNIIIMQYPPPPTNADWLRNRVNEICRYWKCR